VKDLFPEIELIEDKGLKEKVIAVWEDALKLGGWVSSDLFKIPFTLLIPECPVNLLDHTRVVTKMSLSIFEVIKEFYGEKVLIERDNLLAGALLHDIGKLLEYSEKEGKFTKSKTGELLRHPFSGAGLAYKHGLPEEVIHIIAVHAKEGDGGKRTPEAVIIHHVDFINFESLRRINKEGICHI